MNRLRELHELGADPAFERFPASEELFLVKQPKDNPVNVVGEAAVLRATLWQYLREQADAGQLKALKTAGPPACSGTTSPERCAWLPNRARTRRRGG
ncbi:hypothetical protein ABT030_35560 [Streptomyces mirabilis]|uniref:hypothetical protein n=1 Tax=Streptomyces mirabilis TaxID=68239 RepID=UPI00332D503D